MHAPSYSYQADYEFDYAVDYGRKDPERAARRRRPSYSRGGNRPVMVNGIFRRRHRRISW